MNYARLILIENGQPEEEYHLFKPEISLGRATSNDIVIPARRVSRQHARLTFSGQGCFISDLGSTEGTFVDGQRIADRAPLPFNTTLLLGDRQFLFLAPLADDSETEPVRINSEGEWDRALDQMTIPIILTRTDQSRLVVQVPGHTWDLALEGETITIGRGSENDLVIDDTQVSRQHARLENQGNIWLLHDVGSTNGTWIGSRAVDRYLLTDRTVFRIGPARLFYSAAPGLKNFIPAESGPGVLSPVVFVPGLMGSELWLGNERVWPDTHNLIRHPEVFRYSEATPLRARGLVETDIIVPNLIKLGAPSRLGDYLVEELGYQRGVNLLEFAYDWRQDVRRTARQLARTLAAWRAPRPLTLIAHNLGALAARYFIERLGGNEIVQRLILLGSPNQGMPYVAGALLTRIHQLPFGLMGLRLSRVVGTFPSAYQLLPLYPSAREQNGDIFSLVEDESWVSGSYLRLLRSARQFHQELGSHSSVPTLSIFGYGLKTISAIAVQRDPSGAWENIVFETSPTGDSLLPTGSADLPGATILPVHQYHGALYRDQEVKLRLKQELLDIRSTP